MKTVNLITKTSKANLANWGKEVNCDCCQELRVSTLIHNTSSSYRYKAANPTPLAGVPDTLRPWILQVDTHLQLASIGDPALQLLVATQFLVPGLLTWVQTLEGVTTWTALKEQMINYYQPPHEELRARDSLHSLRQRRTGDEYSKAFNELVIKVPQMTLEEKLYVFIKGLKHNVQVSVSLHSPTTIEQAKLLAANADGILSSQRYYGGGPSSGFGKATPMKMGAVGLPRTGWNPPSMSDAAPLVYALSVVRRATELINTATGRPTSRKTDLAFSRHRQRASKGPVVEEAPHGGGTS
jgi:Retrotransposon gag protein